MTYFFTNKLGNFQDAPKIISFYFIQISVHKRDIIKMPVPGCISNECYNFNARGFNMPVICTPEELMGV